VERICGTGEMEAGCRSERARDVISGGSGDWTDEDDATCVE